MEDPSELDELVAEIGLEREPDSAAVAAAAAPADEPSPGSLWEVARLARLALCSLGVPEREPMLSICSEVGYSDSEANELEDAS